MSNVSVSGLLSELPAGWSWQSLGDVLKVRNGFAFKSSDYKESGVLLIRQSNLGGNRVSLDKAEYLPEQFLENHKDFRIRKGDVLIGMSGSIGKLCVYDRDEPALQNQRTGLLQFKDDSLKRWIWHYLPLIENKLHEGGKGIGVQNISASQIEALPIPIAPKEHRAYIVAEIEKQFSRLDEAITNLKRVKANLKRYKAAVLKAAVEGKLTEEWRKQHPDVEPASQLLERILDERRAKMRKSRPADLAVTGAAVNGWVSVPVGMVCEIVDGDRGSDYPKKSDFHSAGHCLFLSTKNVRPNGFLFEDNQFITRGKHKQLRKGILERGDIVFTSRGTIGNIAHYGKAIPYECVRINSGMFIIREFSDLLDEKFFEWYLRSDAIRDQIARLKSGTAQPQLPIREFRSLRILFPSQCEQEEVVREVERRMSVIEELEAAVEANLTRADRLRQSILSQAFSGRLIWKNSCEQEGTVRCERAHA